MKDGRYREELRQAEREILLRLLHEGEWIPEVVCALGGIPRRTLFRRCAMLGIPASRAGVDRMIEDGPLAVASVPQPDPGDDR